MERKHVLVQAKAMFVSILANFVAQVPYFFFISTMGESPIPAV